jgi:RHS repeat-associated protein
MRLRAFRTATSHHRPRVGLLLTSVVLVASILGAPSAVAEVVVKPASSTTETKQISDTDPDDGDASEASNTAAAVVKAAATGQPVEDMSQRTEFATVTANPDGSFTRKQYETPVRVKRDGEWLDIDSRLELKPDGTYGPKVSATPVVIGGKGSQDAGRVDLGDEGSLTFTWPTKLPEPSIDGPVATYKLSDTTDLLMIAGESGLSARVRLNEQPAKDDPVYKFGLRTDNVSINEEVDGQLTFENEKGKTVGEVANLVAWDAKTDKSGEPTEKVELEADVATKSRSGDVTNHSLEVQTPDGYLSDPDTQYPVTIDPDVTVSMAGQRDTFVREGDTADHSNDGYLAVGRLGNSANTHPTTSLIQFSLDEPVYLEGKNIISAQMGLRQYKAATCDALPYTIQPNTSFWAAEGLKYPGPTYRSGDAVTVRSNSGSTCSVGEFVVVDALPWVKAWIDNATPGGPEGYQNYGLRISVGATNANANYERRFCSLRLRAGDGNCPNSNYKPYLRVTYRLPDAPPPQPTPNSAPNKPTGMTLTRGGNPVNVYVNVSDTNAETALKARLKVKRAGDSTVLWQGDSDSISLSANQTGKVVGRLPYLPDGKYEVTATSVDTAGASSDSTAAKEFTIDTEFGAQEWFSTTQHGINDRSGLQINNRTGNLAVQASDIKVNGHGLDLDVTRFYNSELIQTATQGIVKDAARTGTSMGKGWSLSVGPDVFLEKRGENYLYHAPGGTVFGPFKPTNGSSTAFDRLKDGSGADLKKNSGSGSDPFTLTFRKSQMKLDFATVGATGDAYLSKMRDRSGNHINFNYADGATTPNGRAKLSSITDASDRSYAVTYTGDNITKIAETGTGAREWNYQYDANGYLTKLTNPAPNNYETTYQYVASPVTGARLLSSVTGPKTTAAIEYNDDVANGGSTVEQEKPDLDRVKTMTYRKNSSTTHTFQWSYGRTSAATRCPDSTDQYSTNVVDANAKTTTYCFADGDGDAGSRIRVKDDLGNVKTTGYTADKGVQNVTNPSNNATLGSTEVTYGGGALSDRMNQVTEPKNSSSQSTKQPTTTFAYGDTSEAATYLPTTVSDPNGDCSMFEYNEDGYTTASYTGIATDPTSGSCSKDDNKIGSHRSYNGDGTVSKSWDANAYGAGENDKKELDDDRKTIYTYWPTDDTNKRGGMVKTIRKPGGSCDAPRKLCTDYDYDYRGRVTKITDGRGDQTSYTYDEFDRTASVFFDGATACNATRSNCITYAYDGEGNMTNRNDRGKVTSFAYDGMNRQTQQSTTGTTRATAVNMDYDGNGNLTSYQQKSGLNTSSPVTYSYDGANRLTSVKTAIGEIKMLTNADGRVTKITYPGSTHVDYDYTKAGQPKKMTVDASETSSVLRTYEYDYTKNLAPDGAPEVLVESKQLQKRIVSGADVANRTTKYKYSEGRIASSAIDGLPNYTYTHDKIGNVLSETSAGSTKYFGYDRAGQLCWRGSTSPTAEERLDTTCHAGPSGSANLSQDAAGNNRDRANTSQEIWYDTDSRVSQIGGVDMSYLDRGNDLRTAAGSITYVDGPLGITLADDPEDTTTFIRDPNGQILATYGAMGTQFYVSEFNGSVAALYNTSAEETGEYVYSPYGSTTATGSAGEINPIRYIGGYQDKDEDGDDNYYKLGARYYDGQGHFTQPDPIVPGGGDYTYASGDPINSSDPSGLFSIGLSGKACFGVCIGGDIALDDNGNLGLGLSGGLGSPGLSGEGSASTANVGTGPNITGTCGAGNVSASHEFLSGKNNLSVSSASSGGCSVTAGYSKSFNVF